jgi:hypothetical protein
VSRPAHVKATVVVEPSGTDPEGSRSVDPQTGEFRHYKVVETTNTTSPFLGEVLSKAAVEGLISKRITVKVRPAR